ncbi:MAG: hypothetical protein A2V66_00480 [Ignavibacteria bacterium RBG_13_36_8]|nr:MAG: hypothetical protein A2V66_00480 [Ignavibacteria bacterium RBG_13_36_8]
MSQKFFKMIKKHNISYKHVAEVGVYKPETANILGFIEEGTLCSLFEANPQLAKEITDKFSAKYNVKVYPYAICGFDGKTRLYDAASSSFLETIDASPAILHDGYIKKDEKTIEVEARRFSHFDAGDIDILSIDVEGGEWDVIKEMKSRPKVLSLEIKSRDYVNPNLASIAEWLDNNLYQIWFEDDTDTVFIKRGVVKLNIFQKIRTRFHSRKYFGGKLI